MLHTPNVITDKLMTAAYISLQINSIAVTAKKMTMLVVSAALISFETTSVLPNQETRMPIMSICDKSLFFTIYMLEPDVHILVSYCIIGA